MFKINKYLALLVVIVCLLSISVVSAVDTNDDLQLSNDVKNFTYLNDTIQGKDVVELDCDVVKDSDEGFLNGIQITKSVTINGNGHYIDANYLGQIFAIKNSSVQFTLNNVILKNGNASVASAINADFGAYVYLNDCQIINNGNFKTSSSVSYIYGGAIKVGNIFCTNTIFDGNYITRLNSTSSGYGYGGVMYISGNYVNLTNCTFNNNYVKGINSFNYIMGAVLYFDINGKSALNVINSSFNNNYVYNVKSDNKLTGYAMGATIYTESDQTYIYNSTFSNNKLEASVVYGGAIQVDDNYKKNNITVTSSTFTNNSCIGDKGYGGALYIDSYSDLFVYSSVFDGNYIITTDKAYGGAIYCIYRYNKNIFIVENSTFVNNYLESVNEAYGAGMVYPYTDYNNNVQLNITNSNFENNIINVTSSTKKVGGAGLSISGNSYATIENVTFKNNKFVGEYASSGYGDGLYLKTKLLLSCENVSFIGNSLYNVGNTNRNTKEVSNDFLLTANLNDNAIVATLILISYSFDTNSKIINDGVMEVKQITNFTELQNVLNLISSKDKSGVNAGILVLTEDINKTKEEEESFKEGAVISSDIQIEGSVTIDANSSGSLFKIKEGVTASFREVEMTNPAEDVPAIINKGNVSFGEVCNFTTLDMAINLIQNDGILILLNDIVKTGTELDDYLGGINLTKHVIIDGQGKYGINPVKGTMFNQSSYVTYKNMVFFAGNDFTSLNESILNAINSGSFMVRFSGNVTKQASEYSTFANGIIIKTNVTVDGAGYSINSASGSLFTVNSNCNLTLMNIKLNNTGVAINNNGRVILDVTNNKLNVTFSESTNKILNGRNAYVRINNVATMDQFYNTLNLINYGSNDLNIEFYRITNNDNFNTIQVNGNFNLIAFKSDSLISYYGSKVIFDVKKGATLKISNVTSIYTYYYNFIHNNGTVIFDSCTFSNKVILNDGIIKMNFNDFNSFGNAINAIKGGDLVLTSDVINNGGSQNINVNNVNLTIDGNGFIIDAKSKSIFKINKGSNITLKNMVLINSINLAIVNDGNLSIIGCTFKNNTVDNISGVITNNQGNLSVSDCIYENNNEGAMIYTYFGSLYLNNIVVSNLNEVVVISNGTNIRSKVTAVVLNNSTLKAKIGFTYAIDVVYYDTNNNIIAILNNSTVLFDNVAVGNFTNKGYHSVFYYTPTSEGSIVVGANCSELSDLDVKTGIIKVNYKLSFSDLQELINNNDVVNLTDEVVFNPTTDLAYRRGMVINKSVTIKGNGFTIDASKIAIFFNIKENGSLNLVNINLINASDIAIINYGNLSLNSVSTKGNFINKGVITSEVIVKVYGGDVTTYDSFIVTLKTKDGNNVLVPKLTITDDQGHEYNSTIGFNGIYVFYVPKGITGQVTFNNATVNGFTNVSSSGYLNIKKYHQNNFKGVLNKVVKNPINFVDNMVKTLKSTKLHNLVNDVVSLVQYFNYNFKPILNFFIR